MFVPKKTNKTKKRKSYLEFDSVYDSHLLEEGRLSALAGAQQQQLDLSAKGLSVLLEHAIDLLTFVALLDLVLRVLESQATSTRPR